MRAPLESAEVRTQSELCYASAPDERFVARQAGLDHDIDTLCAQSLRYHELLPHDKVQLPGQVYPDPR